MPKALKLDRTIAVAVNFARVSLVASLLMSATTAFGDPLPARAAVEEATRLAGSGNADEAEQLLRKHLHSNPADEQAYHSLLALRQTRELSATSASYRLAQQKLPQNFRVTQTPRFVLLSDAPARATQQHAQWVERACEEFERFVADCGLRPLPLEHKLVCVLFERHDEYQSFARRNDGMNNAAFTGYYSPKNDRVVFSLPQSRSGAVAAQGAPSRNEDQTKPVLGFGASAEGNHDSCDHHLPGEAAAKCVHETIHQLMFHTRLMSADLQYPLWICEGLSTAFETEHPDQRFGPDQDFAPRRRGFDNLLLRNEAQPLRELVTLTNLSSRNPEFIRAVYHQSYGLVTWLCRNRPAQLRQYLQSMLNEPSGKLAPGRHLELFEQSFGAVDKVEQEWLSQEYASLQQRRSESR